MKKLVLAVLALFVTAAFAQAPTRVRGTITAVDGDVISVKSRDGRDLKLQLAPQGRVATAKAIKLDEIKQGTYIGITAMKGGDGRLSAVEVHTIPPQAPAGHMPWDLQPGSTMTNANLSGTAMAAGGNEITVEAKGESYKILVPAGIPIATSVPAERSALKPGESIFAIGQPDASGVIQVGNVTVSKDGFGPPQ